MAIVNANAEIRGYGRALRQPGCLLVQGVKILKEIGHSVLDLEPSFPGALPPSIGTILSAILVNTQRILEGLGLKPVGREPRRDEDVLIERVRAGLPYSALQTLASRYDLGSRDLLRILHLPQRTLARRRQARVLSADESDRLVRLGRIAALAEETLGNPVKAGRWLREANPVLGDTAPMRWLDTEVGAREVEEVLIRIAHGVPS